MICQQSLNCLYFSYFEVPFLEQPFQERLTLRITNIECSYLCIYINILMYRHKYTYINLCIRTHVCILNIYMNCLCFSYFEKLFLEQPFQERLILRITDIEYYI
jgi:hypothetical protein